MLHFTKKEYGTEEYCVQFEEHEDMDAIMNTREIRDGGIGGRAIEALLEELTPVPLMKESLSFHGLERSLNSSYHRFLDSQMHPESPFRSRHSVLPVPQSD